MLEVSGRGRGDHGCLDKSERQIGSQGVRSDTRASVTRALLTHRSQIDHDAQDLGNCLADLPFSSFCLFEGLCTSQ